MIIKEKLEMGGGVLDERGGVPEPLETSPGYAPVHPTNVAKIIGTQGLFVVVVVVVVVAAVVFVPRP